MVQHATAASLEAEALARCSMCWVSDVEGGSRLTRVIREGLVKVA